MTAAKADTSPLREALAALMKIAHFSPASTVQPVAIAREALIKAIGTWQQDALTAEPVAGTVREAVKRSLGLDPRPCPDIEKVLDEIEAGNYRDLPPLGDSRVALTAPPAPAGREAIAQIVRHYIESAVLWMPDKGTKGWNGLDAAETIDLLTVRMVASLSPQGDRTTVSAPEAWAYELATVRSADGVYGGWERRLSWSRPNTPEGSMRNLRALSPCGEPVAWRWRTLPRFREDGDTGEWSWIETKPDFINPHHHELEPLYATPPVPGPADRAAVIEECARAFEKSFSEHGSVNTAIFAIRALAPANTGETRHG